MTQRTTRIVTTTHRYKRPPRKRAVGPAKSVQAVQRFPELPAHTTYWLSTKTELKDPTITLHVEGCPVLRRIQWRTLSPTESQNHQANRQFLLGATRV
jgi:hypothetical protein